MNWITFITDRKWFRVPVDNYPLSANVCNITVQICNEKIIISLQNITNISFLGLWYTALICLYFWLYTSTQKCHEGHEVHNGIYPCLKLNLIFKTDFFRLTKDPHVYCSFFGCAKWTDCSVIKRENMTR